MGGKCASWATITAKLNIGSSVHDYCIPKNGIIANFRVDETRLTRYATNQLVDIDDVVRKGKIIYEILPPYKTNREMSINPGSAWNITANSYACADGNAAQNLFSVSLKDIRVDGLDKNGTLFLIEMNLMYPLTTGSAGIINIQDRFNNTCATMLGTIVLNNMEVSYWSRTGDDRPIRGRVATVAKHNGVEMVNVWVGIFRDGDVIKGCCFPKLPNAPLNTPEGIITWIVAVKDQPNYCPILLNTASLLINQINYTTLYIGNPYYASNASNLPLEWQGASQAGMFVYGVYYANTIF